MKLLAAASLFFITSTMFGMNFSEFRDLQNQSVTEALRRCEECNYSYDSLAAYTALVNVVQYGEFVNTDLSRQAPNQQTDHSS